MKTKFTLCTLVFLLSLTTWATEKRHTNEWTHHPTQDLLTEQPDDLTPDTVALRGSATFRVRFKAKPGAPDPPEQWVQEGKKVTVPKAPTREGHKFVGWRICGERPLYDFDTPVRGAFDLCTEWTPHTHAISFHSDGAFLFQKDVTHGTRVEKPTQIPKKNGHVFDGWTKQGSLYDFNTVVIAPFKLEARFKKSPSSETFTVSFDAKGGTPTPQKQTITKGSKVKRPTAPKKNGLVFDNWYKNGIVYNFSDAVYSSFMLEANYNNASNVTHNVTFNPDGGSPTPNSQKVADGKTATKPADPSRSGYHFKGWMLNGNTFSFTTPIRQSINLKAKWEKTDGSSPGTKTFTVTFNPDGGSPTPYPLKVANGKTATKPADPQKTGYKFKGWMLNGNTFNFTTPITKDITLKASWGKGSEIPIVPPSTTETFTVTFNPDGGSPSPYPLKVAYGKTATKPTDPQKAGYKFKGWMLDGSPFNFTTAITKDITLKATWGKGSEIPVVPPSTTETFTITFNPDGGSPTPYPLKVTYGKTASKPANPYKARYRFTGWQKDGVYYDFDTPIKSSFTLTATWELVTANINISADEEVHFYPNPINDRLYLTCEVGIDELRLFNIQGQCLQLLKPTERTNVTVEMSTLPAGIYLIKATTPKGTATLKVIKR